MRKIIFFLIVILCIVTQLYAAQSTIKIAEGTACMGDDKTRKQTENLAMTDAKRNAIEQVRTYVSSSTEVHDFELKQDLVTAYADAKVEVIEELGKGWYKDTAQGDCYKVKIKADVIPNEKAMKKVSDTALDDPTLPLAVKVWSDKEIYSEGEKMKIYLKGNKPFFARVIYRDAGNNNLQLLPNPYRQDNYFLGGVTYAIPSGTDKFEMEVNPPFGEESITVYASVAELGDITLNQEGPVFAVKTKPQDISIKTRSIKIKEVSSENAQKPVAFSTGALIVKTKR